MVGWHNMDRGESWFDGLEWTPVEDGNRVPQKAEVRSMGHSGDGFLLPSETIIEEWRGVVLVNLDAAGTLCLTNFRLIFLGGNAKQLIPLGTIPLLTIESFFKQVAKAPVSVTPASRRLLTIVGKDLRIISFGFLPHQRGKVREALGYRTRPLRLWELYAFSNHPIKNSDSRQRLRAEYMRLISGDAPASQSNIEEPMRGTSWRLCEVNANYNVCATYPSLMVMPATISDEDVQQAAVFRSKGRIPHLCWQHHGNGAVLARSSQPFPGLTFNSRSNADEKLVAALCGPETQRRKLYIADARPRKNALANVAMGGGSEIASYYLQCEIIYLGIDNIHGMRDSLARLRDFLDIHGAASSDGSSSLLRSGGRAWGSSVSSMAGAVSALGDSGWLSHCQKILTNAVWIAARIALEGASVLVHCSDGWDRTAQFVSLASLMLDPYYRTFDGFQALVEKDWLAFGHMFAERLGTPTFSVMLNMSATDSVRQPGSGSPVRTAPDVSHSVGSHAPGAQSSNYSPIFLQWMDAVAQLLRIYPCAFEFTPAYLVELMDCVLSCRFGNFLCNSEKERVQAGVDDRTACVWDYLKVSREQRGKSHVHYNLFYSRTQYAGVLLPPAAALAPSLWPHYFLRWSCPSQPSVGGCPLVGWVHGGDLQAAAHGIADSFLSVQNAKDKAEERVQELMREKRLLLEQIRDEQEGRISAMATANHERRQAAALKQAIEAVGCKIRICKQEPQPVDTSDEERTDFEDGHQYIGGQTSSTQDETVRDDDKDENQFAVSVSMRSDIVGTTDVSRRPCGADYNSSCRLRPGESCRWPQTGCARIGSAFIGLRADFTALERLSIFDQYFGFEQTDVEGEVSNHQPPSHVTGVT